jgi:hypothetical protein
MRGERTQHTLMALAVLGSFLSGVCSTLNNAWPMPEGTHQMSLFLRDPRFLVPF